MKIIPLRSGQHGVIFYSKTASEFPALLAAGFKRNRLTDGTPIVDAWLMSGIPAKAEREGIIEWPEYPAK